MTRLIPFTLPFTLLLTFSVPQTASAEFVERHAHSMISPPSVDTDGATGESGASDDEMLAWAMFAVLRYDHSNKTKQEVVDLAVPIIEAAREADIDPYTALTVVFLESRFEPAAVGDGGNACGMAQQHARFSIDWKLSKAHALYKNVSHDKKRRRLRVRHECRMLQHPEYATKVLIHHLSYLQRRFGNIEKSVWMYNGRESYQYKMDRWRSTLRKTHEKIREEAKIRSTQSRSGSS